MGTLNVILIVALALFAARRMVLVIASLFPKRAPVTTTELPKIAVVVACRNEAAWVCGLLASLDALEYRRDRLRVVLVDDASTDETSAILDRWTGAREHAISVCLKAPSGKATALNRALTLAGDHQLVAVYDADQRPSPHSLSVLASAFDDPKLGAASGYRRPANAAATLVSRGAALECFVHQLVVQAGRDRLGWNPPTMGGNCVYRASALAEIGDFPDGSIGEDTEVSLALVANGWLTRFVVDAVAESAVGETWRHYWQQRLRWTRGMYGASRHAVWRLESWMVVFGYVDRLVLLAALVLVALGAMSPVWPMLYLGAPALAVVVALTKVGELAAAPMYLPALLMLFPFELATTLTATLKSLLRRPSQW